MAFPGGKGKSFAQIINLMPKHEVFVDLFLGSAVITNNKRPAKRNVVNDLDIHCLSNISSKCGSLEKHHTDALSLIQTITLCKNTLIYCDPPYVQSVRGKKKIYKHEYSDKQHEALLSYLTKLDCMVLISGYDNWLYAQKLKHWNTYRFSSQTQNGIREEVVWYNYDKPKKLHDSRYLGNNFRERQSIKRRMTRLKNKFQEMEPRERSAFMEWLNQEFSTKGDTL